MAEYFKDIPKIKYEGVNSTNPLSFKYYNPDEVVMGKTMREQLKFALSWWHTMGGDGTDMFGCGTTDKTWGEAAPEARAKKKVDVAFEIMDKLSIDYFCFHDRDLSPEYGDLGTTNAKLAEVVDYIAEKMGFELVNIPMDKNGPDMDMVEKLVAEDDTIKGIWCVPMYANPTGTTYSDEVVKRLAAMKTKAKDFKIFWDNAYCIHHLSDTPDKLLNILDECEKAGNPDRVYMLASTSKVTFPGAGVAMIASSEKNIKYLKSMMTVQTIGYDKINQLRHVKFFGTYENLMEHMKKHRAIIEPKFKIVLDTLEKEIAPLGIGSWEKPNGGYFISFNALNGCAKRICQLCKEAGVVLTGAGATYPYGKDPDDSNIRIAPTFPPESELKIAADVFATAVKLASAEKLLAE